MDRRKVRFWRVLWWSLFTAWLVLTMYLSSQNGFGSADTSNFIAHKLYEWFGGLIAKPLKHPIVFETFHLVVRKLAHFSVHLVLAFFTMRAASWSFSSRKDAKLFAWIFTIAIAAFDELVQLAAPGRVSAFFDAGLNLAGVTIGNFISGRFGPK